MKKISQKFSLDILKKSSKNFWLFIKVLYNSKALYKFIRILYKVKHIACHIFSTSLFKENSDDFEISFTKGSTDIYPPYSYNGIKFQFVTRDYISTYRSDGKTLNPNRGALETTKIQVGDIIFIDYMWADGTYCSQSTLPLNQIRTDGKMDHVFIVTATERSKTRYAQIRVASNTSDYNNKSLDVVNNDYGRRIEFYVYRPVSYVDRKKWFNLVLI